MKYGGTNKMFTETVAERLSKASRKTVPVLENFTPLLNYSLFLGVLNVQTHHPTNASVTYFCKV